MKVLLEHKLKQSMIKKFAPMMDGFNTGLKDNVKRLFFGSSKENKLEVAMPKVK